MSRYDERVRELIGREAADWFVANRAGLRSKEQDSFNAWLKTSPVHVEEYLAIAALSRDLREVCTDSEQDIEAVIARARLETDAVRPLESPTVARVRARSFGRLQTALAVATSLLVLGLVMLAFWSYRPISRRPADLNAATQHYRTRHGEQETRRLADNSLLQLNTDSAATVRYDSGRRLVVLDSGEAVFEVARESNRAFYVRAGSAEIRVLGTKFDVRLDGDIATITVLEGRVAVGADANSRNAGPESLRQPFVQLTAGQQVRMVAGGTATEPRMVDTRGTVAWLHRQILFEHESLERVANEFNRYTPLRIEIATPSLRRLEISGVFATDDTEAFIAFLRSLAGVRVEVTPTQVRVSRD